MLSPKLQRDIEHILTLHDDGEGNPLHYQKSTIEAALGYIPRVQLQVLALKKKEIGEPTRICPGPDNSIDVLWEVPGEYEILFNVKPDMTADYFADFYDGSPLQDKYVE